MSDDLMTVRQLQTLLRLDRTTIYHMLSENQLPGFKVGGQWRFARQEVDRWLSEQQQGRPPASPPAAESPGLDVLPLHCLQPIQHVFAESMDVGGLTTSVDGQLVTAMSNPSAFCAAVCGTPEGMRRCSASWRKLGAQEQRRPELAVCHAGLRYACGHVEVGGQTVALVFAGQFRLTGERPDPQAIRELALSCGLDVGSLLTSAAAAPQLDPATAEKALRLLHTVADTFSQIGAERLALMSRLRRISEMSAI